MLEPTHPFIFYSFWDSAHHAYKTSTLPTEPPHQASSCVAGCSGPSFHLHWEDTEDSNEKTRINHNIQRPLLCALLSPNSTDPNRFVLGFFSTTWSISNCLGHKEGTSCMTEKDARPCRNLSAASQTALEAKSDVSSHKVEEENINLFWGKLRIACAWNP